MAELEETTYVPFIYCSRGGAGDDHDADIFSGAALDEYERRQKLRDPSFKAGDDRYYGYFGEPSRSDVVMVQVVRDLGRRKAAVSGTVLEIATIDAKFESCLVCRSEATMEWLHFDKNKYIVDEIKAIVEDHSAGDSEKLTRIRGALTTVFPRIENEKLKE
jgi:hypothetical protein